MNTETEIVAALVRSAAAWLVGRYGTAPVPPLVGVDLTQTRLMVAEPGSGGLVAELHGQDFGSDELALVANVEPVATAMMQVAAEQLAALQGGTMPAHRLVLWVMQDPPAVLLEMRTDCGQRVTLNAVELQATLH